MTDPQSSDPVLDVSVEVTAELGRCRLRLRDILRLSSGAVVSLDRDAGSPIDLLVNGHRIARGHVVAVEDCYGFQISEVIQRSQARDEA